MWALTSRPIESAEALQLLHRYKSAHSLQSNQWLLPRHLAMFGVRPLFPPQLALPTNGVVRLPLSAVPFAAMPASARQRALLSAPPPFVQPGACLVLERAATGLRWRRASLQECFDAAFVRSDAPLTHPHLLCDPALAPNVALGEAVPVFNAQETNNAFLVDDDLIHRHLLTGAPLPHSIGSALTTIAAQFHYTSFDWVEQHVAPSASLAPHPGATPHLVHCAETLQLAHISQMPTDAQSHLVDAAPRSVIVKGASAPFIFHSGRWRHLNQMGVTRRLGRSDIPGRDEASLNALQPLLWVVVEASAAVPGLTTQVERSLYRRFFNAQQLRLARSGETPSQEAGADAEAEQSPTPACTWAWRRLAHPASEQVTRRGLVSAAHPPI